MCLACEMDTLWFPEIETVARASSPLPVRKKSPLSASETPGGGSGRRHGLHCEKTGS